MLAVFGGSPVMFQLPRNGLLWARARTAAVVVTMTAAASANTRTFWNRM